MLWTNGYQLPGRALKQVIPAGASEQLHIWQTALRSVSCLLSPLDLFHLSTTSYAVCELRMSESPASRMAMVEQRKSFPHAVPSSICVRLQVSRCHPPQPAGCFSGLERDVVVPSRAAELLR